jgi:hypothetical protein
VAQAAPPPIALAGQTAQPEVWTPFIPRLAAPDHLPLGHTVHDVEFVDGWMNCPYAHVRQPDSEVVLAADVYKPWEQAVQVLPPATKANLPLGHAVHLRAPGTELNWPVGHAVHVFVAPNLYFPAGHALQLVTLLEFCAVNKLSMSVKCPSEQNLQASGDTVTSQYWCVLHPSAQTPQPVCPVSESVVLPPGHAVHVAVSVAAVYLSAGHGMQTVHNAVPRNLPAEHAKHGSSAVTSAASAEDEAGLYLPFTQLLHEETLVPNVPAVTNFSQGQSSQLTELVAAYFAPGHSAHSECGPVPVNLPAGQFEQVARGGLIAYRPFSHTEQSSALSLDVSEDRADTTVPAGQSVHSPASAADHFPTGQSLQSGVASVGDLLAYLPPGQTMQAVKPGVLAAGVGAGPVCFPGGQYAQSSIESCSVSITAPAALNLLTGHAVQ